MWTVVSARARARRARQVQSAQSAQSVRYSVTRPPDHPTPAGTPEKSTAKAPLCYGALCVLAVTKYACKYMSPEPFLGTDTVCLEGPRRPLSAARYSNVEGRIV